MSNVKNTSKQNASKNQWIQALRALSAIWVMCYHLIPYWEHISFLTISKTLISVSSAGYAGVDVFFVISGYVIGLTITKRETTLSNGIMFLKIRFARIYSGYWLVLVLTVILSIIEIRPLNHFTEKLFGSVFLLSKKMDGNLLEVAWSLSYEVSFYVLSFFLIFIFKKPTLRTKIIFLCYFVFLYNLYWYLFHRGLIYSGVWPLRYTINAMTIEFLMGLYVATLPSDTFKQATLIPVFLFIALITCLAGAHSMEYVNYELLRISTLGVSGLCLLLTAITLHNCEFHNPSIFNRIGDSSYSLYLLHPLILSVVAFFLPILSVSFKNILICALPFICILISFIWHQKIEKKVYEKTCRFITKPLFTNK